MTRIYTIGFTKKSARDFFGLLRGSGATRLVDVRLNNVSQLAGFAKREDLSFFLTELLGMDYTHRTDLAPTRDMLDAYKKKAMTWSDYEKRFIDLMVERHMESNLSREVVDDAVLLCSEETPHRCHRRLVAEYLASHWDGVCIIHLT